MEIAVWIIVICEVVRAAQNVIQLIQGKRAEKSRDNLYAEFIDSLKDTDQEFVRKMLEEYESRSGE